MHWSSLSAMKIQRSVGHSSRRSYHPAILKSCLAQKYIFYVISIKNLNCERDKLRTSCSVWSRAASMYHNSSVPFPVGWPKTTKQIYSFNIHWIFRRITFKNIQALQNSITLTFVYQNPVCLKIWLWKIFIWPDSCADLRLSTRLLVYTRPCRPAFNVKKTPSYSWL